MQKIITALVCFTFLLSACSPAAEPFQDTSSNNTPPIQQQVVTSSSSNNGNSNSGSQNSSSSICPEILEKFNKFKIGMPYEQAVQILGVEGEVLNREPTVFGEPSIAYLWKFTVPCVAFIEGRFTKNDLEGFGFGQTW
jgi:hypothetical protein